MALWDPFRLDPHMSTNVGFFMLRTNSASVPAIFLLRLRDELLLLLLLERLD